MTNQDYHPEQTVSAQPESKYTMRWLLKQTIYTLVLGGIISFLVVWVDVRSNMHLRDGLLAESTQMVFSETTAYCFPLIIITVISLMFIEVAYRKNVFFLQYILIGCALGLFFMMLLAFAEKIGFLPAYALVTTMITGLISWFMNGITHLKRAVITTAAILIVEYGVILMLAYIGTMALLAGSIVLFILIAAAMYLTLKLRVRNKELTFK